MVAEWVRAGRRAHLWGAVALLPIVALATERIGLVLALLALAGAGAVLLLLLWPVYRRSRSQAAFDEFEPDLFSAEAALPVQTALKFAGGKALKDPRPWTVRAMTNGLAIGRLRVTPASISFTANARNGGDALSFEMRLGDVTVRGVDGDGGRAALLLELGDGDRVRIVTVNPGALRRVVQQR